MVHSHIVTFDFLLFQLSFPLLLAHFSDHWVLRVLLGGVIFSITPASGQYFEGKKRVKNRGLLSNNQTISYRRRF
jgi:hypothetical protein